jgi:hypothetical protein
MSTAYLRTLIDKRATITDAAVAVLDKCATAGTDPTPEQRSQLAKWDGDAKALDAEIAEIEAVVNGARRFADVANRAAAADEAAERRDAARRDTREEPTEVRSVGARFIESAEFKAYNGHGSSGRVEFADFLGIETRGAITTADANNPPYKWDGPAGPSAVTPFLGLIGREPVNSGSVDYLVWSEATGAAVVPEGGLKPEADLTTTPASATLDTIAYWKPITRQALEDYPRIRAIVEGKLRRGLALKLEELAAATLTGVTNTVVQEDLAGIREAIGEIQGAGYAANAVALNPSDFAALDIGILGSTTNGPSAYGTYWGARPVAVPGIPAGTAYVGDFSEGVTWFDRNTAGVYMTDSHADFFIRNQMLILAEQRAHFALTDAAALAKVTINALTPPVALSARSASK